MLFRYIKIFTLSCSAALICSCSNNLSYNHYANNNMKQARELISTTDNNPIRSIKNKLEAAELLLNTNMLVDAELLLKDLPDVETNHELFAYKRLLMARIALLRQDSSRAKQLISDIWDYNSLSNELQIKYLNIHADILQYTGYTLDAVEQRIKLNKILDESTRYTNNQSIFNLLNQLTPNKLRDYLNKRKDNTLNGWVAFTYISKQYDTHPEQLQRALKLWENKFSDHPAKLLFSKFNTILDEQATPPVKKIALLLPQQGPHAATAKAIRDGFLTMHFYQNSENKPEIQVFDTSQPGGAVSAYTQAKQQNADFIVGPLIKEDIKRVIGIDNHEIPMIALNTVDRPNAQKNIFQFGLPPELEAQAVVQKAWQAGHRNALVIVPDNEWGKRTFAAFNLHWQEVGGAIISTSTISTKTDYNKEVKQLLGINDSEQRANKLKALGIKFNYEPRMRQDIDCIILATTPIIARQIKPLLNFHYASKTPVYSTSIIYPGQANPTRDKDLDGIEFCDMPWVLDDAIKSKQTHKKILELWPMNFAMYNRLYALGIDAFKVVLHYNQLAQLPDFGISGMTGFIQRNQDNVIERKLMWAKFVNGIPVIANG